MNIKSSVTCILLCGALMACGEPKLDMKMGSDSVTEIVNEMSPEKGMAFLSDMQLIINLRGGDQYALHGYTVDQVRSEAKQARQYVKEKNAAFLRQVVQEMEASGQGSKTLHVDAAGLFSMPEPGYIDRSYSLADLKSIVGDYGGQGAIVKGGQGDNATALPEAKAPQIASAALQENSIEGAPDLHSDAVPNNEIEAQNRLMKKPWQDNSGFIHYPDGSVSPGPVD